MPCVQTGPDTIKHRTYQCADVQKELPNNLCAKHLDRLAVAMADDNPAKYLRGLDTLEDTGIPQPPEDPACWTY